MEEGSRFREFESTAETPSGRFGGSLFLIESTGVAEFNPIAGSKGLAAAHCRHWRLDIKAGGSFHSSCSLRYEICCPKCQLYFPLLPRKSLLSCTFQTPLLGRGGVPVGRGGATACPGSIEPPPVLVRMCEPRRPLLIEGGEPRRRFSSSCCASTLACGAP